MSEIYSQYALNINNKTMQSLKDTYSWPVYVYSETLLTNQAVEMEQLQRKLGITTRYAMKANPNTNILRLFHKFWIQIDASSGYEAHRALLAWIPANKIQLSWQELPKDLPELVWKWIDFIAASRHQLSTYAAIAPNTKVWIRVNPWIWWWAFTKIDTWWPNSSFGIRYEHLNECNKIAQDNDLTIHKLHIHIGSENSLQAWADTTKHSLSLLKHLPDVIVLNMWWGFKIAINQHEESADIPWIVVAMLKELKTFEQQTWRKIHLEIEPGKYLVLNTCSLLCQIHDIEDTGLQWYKFIKVDTWMTELPRPSMYWVQQPIEILNNSTQLGDYVVIGHNCESGDLLTPKNMSQKQ